MIKCVLIIFVLFLFGCNTEKQIREAAEKRVLLQSFCNDIAKDLNGRAEFRLDTDVNDYICFIHQQNYKPSPFFWSRDIIVIKKYLKLK